MAPRLTGILETAIYVNDLEGSVRFYEAVLGLGSMSADDRICALNVADRQVLLLCKRGASTHPIPTAGGIIPPHDATGPSHFAFSIAPGQLALWEDRLRSQGIAIVGRVNWSGGGTSLYFRDPDGHLVELATPGIWPIY
jgi:catechol 2,3-dioxygenase-like lactoylglutathione lyase family enzyme